MNAPNALRRMAANGDTASTRSSVHSSVTTMEDLEEARQRLLEHQHHQEVEEEDEERTQFLYSQSQIPPYNGRRRLPEVHNYGAVTPRDSPAPPQAPSNQNKAKRYRLPFLIILGFDWGLVVFLSVLLAKVNVRNCL